MPRTTTRDSEPIKPDEQEETQILWAKQNFVRLVFQPLQHLYEAVVLVEFSGELFRYRYMNPAAEHLLQSFACSAHEFLNKTPDECFAQPQANQLTAAYVQVLTIGASSIRF